MWFNNVLPTLLPFIIATNMLILLGFAEFAGDLLAPVMRKIFGLPGTAGFAFFAGVTCGYPVGAKVVSDLRRSGKISEADARHLLAFCNNAGPLFILGVVGVGMFNSARVGYILWAAHVLAALAVGILFRISPPGRNAAQTPEAIFQGFRHVKAAFSKYRENIRSNTHSAGNVLGESVKNAMESMALIGGLIIFFSVVVAVLEAIGLIGGDFLGGIGAGLFEITGGTRRISSLSPTVFSLAAASFVIAFGGFSVHAQSLHFTAGTGVKSGEYLFAKLLHGIIAALFTLVLIYSVGTVG